MWTSDTEDETVPLSTACVTMLVGARLIVQVKTRISPPSVNQTVCAPKYHQTTSQNDQSTTEQSPNGDE